MRNLIAGGCAGLVESSICHPLDTIKTRMQLRRNATSVEKVVVKMRDSMMEPAMRLTHSLREPKLVHEPGIGSVSAVGASKPHGTTITVMSPGTVKAPLGPIGTARRIVEREGVSALYKVRLRWILM